jgi:hypothetical protein
MRHRTELFWASVAEGTKKRYLAALEEFLAFADTLAYELNSITALDTCLNDFIHDRFTDDPSPGERQLCTNAKCAVQLVLPEVTGALHKAQRALSGWHRLTPSKQRVPVTLGFTIWLFEYLAKRGDFELGLLCLLCFHALLRVNEALSLLVADISLPTPHQPGGIRLRQTKSGLNQAVVISDDLLVRGLRVVMTGKAPTCKLLSCSYSSVRLGLGRVATELGLSDAQAFTAHSFRHGAASHLFAQGMPYEDIVAKGRWVAPKTAKRYIQAGAALAFGSALPSPVSQRIDELLQNQAPLHALCVPT